MAGGPTIGLDIGSRTIKVAEAAPGRNGATITKVGMAPTPPGAMENNIVVDAQLLGQAVKKLLRDAGISVKRSVSSVSGQGALVVRVITVPKMTEAELQDTMRWEVERHVPFAANEVIMDFAPIERADIPPDAQEMDVLLAVAQQDMIDRHVEMLLAAGLKPSAIDVEPLAAARALIELGPNPFDQKSLVIVNIGASNTDIGVYRDGIMAFARTLPLAGDAMTRAIAAQMGIPDDQAEELKEKYAEVLLDQIGQPQAALSPDEGFLDFSIGTPEPTPPTPMPAQRMPFDFSSPEGAEGERPSTPELSGEEVHSPTPPVSDSSPTPPVPPAVTGQAPTDATKLQVFNAIAPVLSELITEVRRSLEYYRGRSADGRIDEIFLCGGTAKIPNLDQFMQQELGITTRVADPFQFAALAARNYSGDYLNEIKPSFAVAVGLAARDMVTAVAPMSATAKRGKKK